MIQEIVRFMRAAVGPAGAGLVHGCAGRFPQFPQTRAYAGPGSTSFREFGFAEIGRIVRWVGPGPRSRSARCRRGGLGLPRPRPGPTPAGPRREPGDLRLPRGGGGGAAGSRSAVRGCRSAPGWAWHLAVGGCRSAPDGSWLPRRRVPGWAGSPRGRRVSVRAGADPGRCGWPPAVTLRVRGRWVSFVPGWAGRLAGTGSVRAGRPWSPRGRRVSVRALAVVGVAPTSRPRAGTRGIAGCGRGKVGTPGRGEGGGGWRGPGRVRPATAEAGACGSERS